MVFENPIDASHHSHEVKPGKAWEIIRE